MYLLPGKGSAFSMNNDIVNDNWGDSILIPKNKSSGDLETRTSSLQIKTVLDTPFLGNIQKYDFYFHSF
jgi:hypothetical protein